MTDYRKDALVISQLYACTGRLISLNNVADLTSGISPGTDRQIQSGEADIHYLKPLWHSISQGICRSHSLPCIQGLPAADIMALINNYLQSIGRQRADITHLPEIILFTEPYYPLLWYAYLLFPDSEAASSSFSYTVAYILSFWQLYYPYRNSHAISMASSFKVITKGKISEHLKECMMPPVLLTFSRSLCLPPALTHFCTVLVLL